MKTMLELLLEREIRRVLRCAADDANADFLAGKLVALRWALAKARRGNRRRVQTAQHRPVNQP
jgi:hypothetical protein